MSILIIRGGKAVPITRSKQMTGEKIPGDLKTWDYFGTDPNELLIYNYDILQGRATTLYHTHPPIAAAINKKTSYAIGPGLVFRSQPDWKTLDVTQKKAKEWGQRFQKLIHYSFKLLNYYSKQSILFRTSKIMGDSLLLFDRQDIPVEGVPFDLIELGGDSIDFQKSADNCTLGIYHDKYKRRKGVALYDVDRVDFRDKNNDQNIIQNFDKLMTRQLRGYPLSYRIIAAAKNNDRWWDAMLARAVLEASVFASVKEDTPGGAREQMRTLAEGLTDENGNAVNATSADTTLTNENVTNVGAGNVFSYGRDGGPMEFSTPKTPADNFDKMQLAYIDMIGMATDIPPECVYSKYSTSYTAHKGAFNDFIKSYTLDRSLFIDNTNYYVILELAKYFFMNNIIEMPHPAFFTNAIIQRAALGGFWMGPVPGHINPDQEVNALITARDNALITPADATYSYGQGGEFEDFIEEWGEQMDEWKGKNIEEKEQIIQNEMEEIEDQEENKEDENKEQNKIKIMKRK